MLHLGAVFFHFYVIPEKRRDYSIETYLTAVYKSRYSCDRGTRVNGWGVVRVGARGRIAYLYDDAQFVELQHDGGYGRVSYVSEIKQCPRVHYVHDPH